MAIFSAHTGDRPLNSSISIVCSNVSVAVCSGDLKYNVMCDLKYNVMCVLDVKQTFTLLALTLGLLSLDLWSMIYVAYLVNSLQLTDFICIALQRLIVLIAL